MSPIPSVKLYPFVADVAKECQNEFIWLFFLSSKICMACLFCLMAAINWPYSSSFTSASLISSLNPPRSRSFLDALASCSIIVRLLDSCFLRLAAACSSLDCCSYAACNSSSSPVILLVLLDRLPITASFLRISAIIFRYCSSFSTCATADTYGLASLFADRASPRSCSNCAKRSDAIRSSSFLLALACSSC